MASKSLQVLGFLSLISLCLAVGISSVTFTLYKRVSPAVYKDFYKEYGKKTDLWGQRVRPDSVPVAHYHYTINQTGNRKWINSNNPTITFLPESTTVSDWSPIIFPGNTNSSTIESSTFATTPEPIDVDSEVKELLQDFLEWNRGMDSNMKDNENL